MINIRLYRRIVDFFFNLMQKSFLHHATWKINTIKKANLIKRFRFNEQKPWPVGNFWKIK